MAHEEKTARIRELNDRLRKTHCGGRVMLTCGVAALPLETQSNILRAVIGFDDFTNDNDPHGEHDCSSLSVSDHRIIWKIDYYDMDMVYASPDPADPAVTARVMTVMLAEEY